jgi:hypothetical protein
VWLLVIATVAVALSKLLLVRLRTTTVLTLLAGRRSRSRAGLDADAAARSVALAARLLHADCLPQAVALATLLQRSGTTPTVVLGCRLYGPSRWGAHAWVEAGGRRFDPLADEGHTELARLDAAGNWTVRPGAAGATLLSDDDADRDPA